jgi:hypothetical protein
MDVEGKGRCYFPLLSQRAAAAPQARGIHLADLPFRWLVPKDLPDLLHGELVPLHDPDIGPEGERVVGRPVGVRVPPSAPFQYAKGFQLSVGVPFSLKMPRVAKKWLVNFLLCGLAFGPNPLYISKPSLGGKFMLPVVAENKVRRTRA